MACRLPGSRILRGRFFTLRMIPSPMSAALRILKDVFGYDAFRGNQAAIIDRVAGGGDALVLMLSLIHI